VAKVVCIERAIYALCTCFKWNGVTPSIKLLHSTSSRCIQLDKNQFIW